MSQVNQVISNVSDLSGASRKQASLILAKWTEDWVALVHALLKFLYERAQTDDPGVDFSAIFLEAINLQDPRARETASRE